MPTCDSRIADLRDRASAVVAALWRYRSWIGAAVLLAITAIGPVATLPGTRVFPLWLWVAAAPVVAISAVDLVCRGRAIVVLVVGLLVTAGTVIALAGSSLTVHRLLSLLGMPGRAAVPAVIGIAIAAAIGVALATVETFRPSGRAVLFGAAVGSMVLADVAMVAIGLERDGGLRDLRLYLVAGAHFVAGLPVYQVTPIQDLPGNATLLPFLYPPPLLPLFGVLSELPWPLVASAWLLASTAGCVAALRLVGVRWLWVPILLLWPPFFEAIWVGNVVVFGLLVLAIAVRLPRRSGTLGLGPLFKPQFAIPAVWLLRGGRWRPLVEGLAAVGVVVLVTLPMVGVSGWVDWIRALVAFQQSAQAMPNLYSFALPRTLPYAAFVGLAVLAVVWALMPRGVSGLRRLGVASVVASPTLYRHGLLEMVPAMVVLDLDLLLVTLGSPVSTLGFWAGVAIVAGGHSRDGAANGRLA